MVYMGNNAKIPDMLHSVVGQWPRFEFGAQYPILGGKDNGTGNAILGKAKKAGTGNAFMLLLHPSLQQIQPFVEGGAVGVGHRYGVAVNMYHAFLHGVYLVNSHYIRPVHP